MVDGALRVERVGAEADPILRNLYERVCLG